MGGKLYSQVILVQKNWVCADAFWAYFMLLFFSSSVKFVEIPSFPAQWMRVIWPKTGWICSSIHKQPSLSIFLLFEMWENHVHTSVLILGLLCWSIFLDHRFLREKLFLFHKKSKLNKKNSFQNFWRNLIFPSYACVLQILWREAVWVFLETASELYDIDFTKFSRTAKI